MNYKNQNPEQIARDKIDALLEEAGWKVQSVIKAEMWNKMTSELDLGGFDSKEDAEFALSRFINQN